MSVFSNRKIVIMAGSIKADEHLTPEQFRDFIRSYSQMHSGFFHVALVKQNGQGYNAAFHAGGKHPKIRIALVIKSKVQSTWMVRDIVEEVLAPKGFSPKVGRTVDSTLQGSLGHVLIVVQKEQIVEANFQKGESWP